MSVAEEAPPDPVSRRRGTELRLGAVIAVALAAAFLVWLLAVRDEGDDNATTATGAGGSGARAATAEEITNLARSLEYPIYWAGAVPDRTYELTRTGSGRVYIRYLPDGAEVGNRDPDYLTVGTYPQANGYAAVRAASRRPNTLTRRTPGGALIVFDRKHPRSTYFSFPGARFQVEVYDPTPGRARQLVLSGRITRVR